MGAHLMTTMLCRRARPCSSCVEGPVSADSPNAFQCFSRVQNANGIVLRAHAHRWHEQARLREAWGSDTTYMCMLAVPAAAAIAAAVCCNCCILLHVQAVSAGSPGLLQAQDVHARLPSCLCNLHHAVVDGLRTAAERLRCELTTLQA